MLHIPILRRGMPYRSMDVATAVHYRTRRPFVEISQANVGLIRRDLLRQRESRDALAAFTVRELVEICGRAAGLFLNGTLPIGDQPQTPDDYLAQLAATTGMPRALARRNMAKIHSMLSNMDAVLAGLSRGLDFDVLDRGYSGPLSYFPRGLSMGVVLPSNSPGVHSLWIPAIPLKTPLVLKPGSAEPWTPYRIAQALLAAGCPPEAFSYYPADHAGANEILRSCGRGMLFGDVGAVRHWASDPRIELHGPGYSKVVLGEDAAADWENYIDVIVNSIAANGGRSCINASGVWTPANGDRIADAVARRLAQIIPRSEDDPEAAIAPFADPNVAARINAMIGQGLAESGAADVTARYRSSPRLTEWDGCSYLLPTVIRCQSPQHALANREFLFPFASVVEVPQAAMPDVLGSTLVVSAITRDRQLLRRLLASPLVGRLNIGPVPTSVISWDQPHEGNLFDHLYARRAFQLSEDLLPA
ncbi:MAG: aldehyde dehydrogenase [Bryobacterales bacterium]|nr:aldehyde dehydrogenase [Bryobacterales bacterium]